MNTLINTRQNDSSEQSLPWYRYGWPWFLISFPLASILLGGVMLYLALQTNNSLVVDDYYKQGKAINVRIERDRMATLLGLSAGIRHTSEGLVLQMTRQTPELSGQAGIEAGKALSEFNWPDELEVRWVHVTQAARDGRATMVSIGGDRYIAQGLVLPDGGKYRVHVQPGRELTWRLVSELRSIGSGSQIDIAAQAPERMFEQSLLQ